MTFLSISADLLTRKLGFCLILGLIGMLMYNVAVLTTVNSEIIAKL